jgi:class 3 adenylate cyclase/tetratricopeptide (TPR) repeat protein
MGKTAERALSSRAAEDGLRPYVPATLLETAARKGGQTWWEWLEGSMMHCDISGFTSMSERLAGLGKEGAELMVGVLNRFFDTMLEIASGYGGVQMKFGGDAMLLYFGGEGHAERAAACGLDMQRAMAAFAKVDAGGQSHSLRMRAGINSGRFFSASAGDPDVQLHYLVTGSDVRLALGIEEAAALGGVGISESTRAHLESAKVRRHRDGWAVVKAVAPKPGSRAARWPRRMPGAYVGKPVREGRTAGPGEHRRVTSVFIDVMGPEPVPGSEDETVAAASKFVSVLVDCLTKHGGYLLGSDVAEDGDKFIAIFGAPVASPGQEDAAIRFAQDLRDGIHRAKTGHTLRIGVNTAFVFAGEVGWKHRREYTVIGDGVNLAARLMAVAKPGEIIVSRATAEKARSFSFRKLRPVTVKGKSAPVEVRRMTGTVREKQAVFEYPLVGRDEEMRRLLSVARRAARGRGQFVRVHGPPGIGKSRLVAELAQRLEAQGWCVVTGRFQAHTRGTPFSGWAEALDDPGIGSTAGPTTAGEDPRARREAAISEIVERIGRKIAAGSTLLVMEDEYWSDESSLAVIERLRGMRLKSLFLCVTSREEPAAGFAAGEALALSELPEEAAAELAAGVVVAPKAREAMLERARGNPLYLVELMRSGNVERSLPDTLNDLMIARIDSLAPEEKQVLRVASVLGPRFEGSQVQALAAPRSGKRTEGSIALLAERGFTVPEGAGTYVFTHSLLADVAYDSAPFEFRRRVHLRAGQLIEREHRGDEGGVSEILLRHFEQAAVAGKAARYAAMAGDRSAAVFANEDALSFYSRGLTALGEDAKGGDAAALLERQGDVLEYSGRHREASVVLQRALAAGSTAAGFRARHVPGRIAPGAAKPVLYRKVAVATEHASDYQGALAWLERARKALPARGSGVRAEVYATTCGVLFREGRYEEAIEWGRKAIAAARGKAGLRQAAYAHHMMGTALVETGRLQAGIGHLRRAVRAYHEMGDYPGQASGNNNLGSTYQLLGMYDAALYHYEVALRADERTGDHVDAAIVHNNMGETLLLLDRVDEAVDELKEVLRIASEESDLEDLLGWAHVTTARAYRARGDALVAAQHLKRGTRILRSVGSSGLLTEAMVDAAEQSLAEGDPRRARLKAGVAMRRATEISSRLAEARAERVLGESLLMEGRRAEAEQRLSASVEGCRRAGAAHEEMRARMALGRLYLERGRQGSARRLFRRAEAYFRRCGASASADEAARLWTEAGG